MENKIIELITGMRYEIKNGIIYSLNYAEKGMSGSSQGKRLPDALAKAVLLEYQSQQEFKTKERKSIKLSERKPKKSDLNSKKKIKLKKKSIETKIKKDSSETSVKLGNLLNKAWSK